MSKPVVGFIGLGAMGVGMAKNIVSADYPLYVMGNRRREPVERLLGLGAKECSTPSELAGLCDVIVLCVTTSDVVENLVYGKEGILAGMQKPLTLVDCGTSIPESTLKIGADLRERGGDMLDVPLGRSAAAAEAGMLNMMVGGREETLALVRPVLETMAENIFHLGELGSGHKIKLINNFFSMTVACLGAELTAAARSTGVDLQSLVDVMSGGPLKSDFFSWLMECPLQGDDTKLSFSINNGRKDVGYYREMIKHAGQEGPLSSVAHQMLSQAIDDGLGEQNVPQVTRWFSKMD